MNMHHCSGCECSGFEEDYEDIQRQKDELERKILRLQNHIIGQDKRLAEMEAQSGTDSQGRKDG